MAKFRTDCIEKPIRMCFRIIGHFIGTHPWWFFIIPVIISTALGSGFYFLEDRTSNDIEEEFTPLEGPAKMERKFIQEYFPQNEFMFSSLRLNTDGIYACFIATSKTNILTVPHLEDILVLDSKVRNMTVEFEDELLQYVDICATVNGSCSFNAILNIIDYNASNVDLINLTFPTHTSTSGRVSLRSTLGSVKINNSIVQSAKAIQLFYYLTEFNQSRSVLWLAEFIKLLSEESTNVTEVSYSTSMSRQWEFEKVPKSIVPLFSITYTITMSFTIVSCLRLDNVRNKVWVATIGVFSTGLAVLSSFGMLLLMGAKFVMTVSTCPFLILGIGIDDMFIMISCWQKTNVHDSVVDRLADTYQDAAISISITTITDVLALYLGYSSPFRSVQTFCLYAGTAILFCYIYNIIFLGAFLALNGQRETSNRHWFTCVKIPVDCPPGKSRRYAICCVGGAYDHDTGTEEEQPISGFFGKYYGPFLTQKWTKVSIVVLYAGYLAVSFYGCFELKEGIDLGNLASDDSYISKYYKDKSTHFSHYGPNVMVAVNEPLAYWEEDQRKTLSSCITDFKKLAYVDKNFFLSWLDSFQVFANDLDINSENTFKRNLLHFLEKRPMTWQDINFDADNKICSSRFFLQTQNISTTKQQKDMLISLRKTAKKCPIALVVYHPSFIYLDQYTVIVDNTIQTIVVATVLMLAISLLLIPNPLCSLWVAFSIGSVIVGVVGFMALWDVSLDSISMINLIICIGFSVNFSAHVSYAFVSSTKADSNEKAVDALAHLGFPIVQGAVSTLLGVLALSFSENYIFRTFFKLIFLVIMFGLVHGVAFLPVFLTFVGMCRNG
ncbi:patched domain-containing protein 3 isoform X1 [Oncorhynchus nerka]|uniref:patched domain-containing protein 3 isoform X1 n=2 Tax=Oncorhynchus nerka TaxID=8023 RepID=UPI0031B7F544